MHKAVRGTLLGAGALVLAAGGVGTYNIVRALEGGSAPLAETADTGRISSTPPSPAGAESLARAFLRTWAAGPRHYEGAASDTDAPDQATTALRGYHDGLRLRSVSFTGVIATGTDATLHSRRVSFTATARVAGGTWTYQGALDVVQGVSGTRSVHWSPAVLYPGLKDGQTLAAGTIPTDAGSTRVLGSDGRTRLTATAFPSLGDIAATIGPHAVTDGESADGGSGVSVMQGDTKVSPALKVFRAPRGRSVETTVDPALQAVAERAVTDSHLGGKPSSVVVLDRRNGHIVALAHHGPHGDTALNAALAPGSTMKIIDAAALFDHQGMTPASSAPCPASVTAAGQVFHNEDDVRADPGTTVREAFAESCNTAFVYDGFHYLVHGDEASVLHDEARDVFGLGSWSIGGGVASADPDIPAQPEGSDKAAQFIGQGRVTMSPLVLASIAATVRDGAFHQPVILPGQKQATAPRPLSASTGAGLREMMRAAVVHGTATPRLGDLPDVGAKTGTAEVGEGTNGWLAAYDDRFAMAALVEGGSSGVDSAGYVVRALLTATP